jgi:uncharacterized membrane protein YjgN (DUF898 family)
MKTDVKAILQSSALTLVLFILFLLIDPPVSPLGWILCAAIFLLLAFITAASFKHRTKTQIE